MDAFLKTTIAIKKLNRQFILLLFVFIGQLVLPTSVKAYDIDTHFYEFYDMAREAGFTHEFALRLALFNQHIDVSRITTPLSFIPGYNLVALRRFHFPVENKKVAAPREDGHLGHTLSFTGLTETNGPLGSEMFTEGLKELNWPLIGGGLHTLMDTYGHSDFGFGGHALAGHRPDDPAIDLKKHMRMRKTLFKALVALRERMKETEDPEFLQFIDTELKTQIQVNRNSPNSFKRKIAEIPNHQRNETELLIAYLADKERRDGLLYSGIHDPKYIDSALNMIQKDLEFRHIIRNESLNDFKYIIKKSIQILDEKSNQGIKTTNHSIAIQDSFVTAQESALAKTEEFFDRMLSQILSPEQSRAAMLEFQESMKNVLNRNMEEMLKKESERRGALPPISSDNVRFTTQDVIREVVRELVIPTLKSNPNSSARFEAFRKINQIFDLQLLLGLLDSDFRVKEQSRISKIGKAFGDAVGESILEATGQTSKKLSKSNPVDEKKLWEEWNRWLSVYNNSPEEIVTHITNRLTENHVAPDKVKKLGAIFETGNLYEDEVSNRIAKKIRVIHKKWNVAMVYNHKGWYQSDPSDAHKKMVEELETEFEESLNRVEPSKKDQMRWIWEMGKFMSSRGIFAIASRGVRNYQVRNLDELLKEGVRNRWITEQEKVHLSEKYGASPKLIQCRNLFR